MNKFADLKKLYLSLLLALPTFSAQAMQVNKLSTYAEECGGEESCAEIAAYKQSSSPVFVTIDTASWTPSTAGFSSFDVADLKNVGVFGENASLAHDFIYESTEKQLLISHSDLPSLFEGRTFFMNETKSAQSELI